eukprot:gene23042-9400_t
MTKVESNTAASFDSLAKRLDTTSLQLRDDIGACKAEAYEATRKAKDLDSRQQ